MLQPGRPWKAKSNEKVAWIQDKDTQSGALWQTCYLTSAFFGNGYQAGRLLRNASVL